MMETWKTKSPLALRRLAGEFRAFASGVLMPGYVGKMRHMADELEQHADALEYAGPRRRLNSKRPASVAGTGRWALAADD